MGNVRTSNRDILAAIEAQTAAISGLVSALTNGQSQEQAPVAEAPVSNETAGYDVPKPYMTHMDNKLNKLVKQDGLARVLYLRKNLAGEVKLAYALKSRWDDGIKDNGMIGAIKVYK